METYYPELVGGTRSFIRVDSLPEFNAETDIGKVIYVKYEDAFYFGVANGWYGLGVRGPTGGTGETGGTGGAGDFGSSGGSGGTGYTGATGGADTSCCYKFAVQDPTKKIQDDQYYNISSWLIEHGLNTNYYFINVFKSDGTEYILGNEQILSKDTLTLQLRDLKGFIGKGHVVVNKALCGHKPKPYHKEQHSYHNVWTINADARLIDLENTEIYFYTIFGEKIEPTSLVGINESQIRATFDRCYQGYSFIWADDNPNFTGTGFVRINDVWERELIVESPTHEWVLEHNLNVEEPDFDLQIEILDSQGNPMPQFDFDFERYETVSDFHKAKGIGEGDVGEEMILANCLCPISQKFEEYNNPKSSDFEEVQLTAVIPPFNKSPFDTENLGVPSLKPPFNNFKHSQIGYFNDNIGYIIKLNSPTTLKVTFFKFKNESLPIPATQCGKLSVRYEIDKLKPNTQCIKKVNEHIHVNNVVSSIWVIEHNLNSKNLRINLDINEDCHYLICYLTPNKIKVYFYKYDHEFLAYENIDPSRVKSLPNNVTLVKRYGHAFIFRAVPLIGYDVEETPSVTYAPEDGRILMHTQYVPDLSDEEASRRMSLKHFPIRSLVVKEKELNNVMQCMTIRHNIGTKENLEIEFYEILDINTTQLVEPDYIVFESEDVLRLYFTVPAAAPIHNDEVREETVVMKRGIVKVYQVPVNDPISPLLNIDQKFDHYKNVVPETYYKNKYTFTHKNIEEQNEWKIKHDLLITNHELYNWYLSSCNYPLSKVDCLIDIPYTINILSSFLSNSLADDCTLNHNINILDISYPSNSEIFILFDRPVSGELTFSIDLPLESNIPPELCNDENRLAYEHIQHLKSHIWYVEHNLNTDNPVVYAICDGVPETNSYNDLVTKQCRHPIPTRIYPKVIPISNNKVQLIFQQVLAYQGAAIITVKDEELYNTLKDLPWLILGEGTTGLYDGSTDWQSMTKQDFIDLREIVESNPDLIPSKPDNLMFQALDNYGEVLPPDGNAVYLSENAIELDFKNLMYLQDRLLNGYCIIKSVDVQYDPTRIDSETVQIYDQAKAPEYLTISTPTTGKAYITDGNRNALRAPLSVIDSSAIFVPPSDTWIIDHDYNTTSLSIRCYDPLGDPIYPVSIEFPSDNQVIIRLPFIPVLNNYGTAVKEKSDRPDMRWENDNYDVRSRLLIRVVSDQWEERNERFFLYQHQVESWKEYVKRTEGRQFSWNIAEGPPDCYWKVRHNLNTKYPKLTFFHNDGTEMKFDGVNGISHPPYRIYYINEQYLEILWLPTSPAVHETMMTPGQVLVQAVDRADSVIIDNCLDDLAGTGGTGGTGYFCRPKKTNSSFFDNELKWIIEHNLGHDPHVIDIYTEVPDKFDEPVEGIESVDFDYSIDGNNISITFTDSRTGFVILTLENGDEIHSNFNNDEPVWNLYYDSTSSPVITGDTTSFRFFSKLEPTPKSVISHRDGNISEVLFGDGPFTGFAVCDYLGAGRGGIGGSPTGGTGATGSPYEGDCPTERVGGTGGSGGTGGTGARNTVSFEAGCCPFDFDGVDNMYTNFGTSVLRFQPDYPNNRDRVIIFDENFNSIPMLTEIFKGDPDKDFEDDGITPLDKSKKPIIHPATAWQWKHAHYEYTIDKGGTRIGVKMQPDPFLEAGGICDPPNQINAYDKDDAAYLRKRESDKDYESRSLFNYRYISDNWIPQMIRVKPRYQIWQFGINVTDKIKVEEDAGIRDPYLHTLDLNMNTERIHLAYKNPPTGGDPNTITPKETNYLGIQYFRLFDVPLRGKEFFVHFMGKNKYYNGGSYPPVQSNPDGSPIYVIPQGLFIIIGHKYINGELNTLSIVRRKTFGEKWRPVDSTFLLVYNFGLPGEEVIYENFVVNAPLGLDHGAGDGWWWKGSLPAEPKRKRIDAGQEVEMSVARIGNRLRFNTTLFDYSGVATSTKATRLNKFPQKDVVIDMEGHNLLELFIDETESHIGYGFASLDYFYVEPILREVDTSNYDVPDICDQHSGYLWKWDDVKWEWTGHAEGCCRMSNYRFLAAHSTVRYYDVSWYQQWYADNPNDHMDATSLVGFTGHPGNTDLEGEQWPEEVLQELYDDYFPGVEYMFETSGQWVWSTRFLEPADVRPGYETDIQQHQQGWLLAQYSTNPTIEIADTRPPGYGAYGDRGITLTHAYTGVSKTYGPYGCRYYESTKTVTSSGRTYYGSIGYYCADILYKKINEGVCATRGPVYQVVPTIAGESPLYVLDPVNNQWVPCIAKFIEEAFKKSYTEFMEDLPESDFTYWYLPKGAFVMWTMEPVWVQILDENYKHDYWELRGGASHWTDYRKFIKGHSNMSRLPGSEAPGCKTEGYDHELWYVWTGNTGRQPSHHELQQPPHPSRPELGMSYYDIDVPVAPGPGEGPGGNPHWIKDSQGRYVWVQRFASTIKNTANYVGDPYNEFEWATGVGSPLTTQIYDDPEYYEYVYWPFKFTGPPGLTLGGVDQVDANMTTLGPREDGEYHFQVIPSDSHVNVTNVDDGVVRTWNLNLLWMHNSVGDDEDHRIIVFKDSRIDRTYPPNMDYDLSGHGLVYESIFATAGEIMEGEVDGYDSTTLFDSTSFYDSTSMSYYDSTSSFDSTALIFLHREWRDYGPVMTSKSGFVWDQWNKRDHRNIAVCQKLAVDTYVAEEGRALYFEFSNALTGDPVNIWWQVINAPEKLEIVVAYMFLHENRWLNIFRDPIHRDIIPGAASVADSWSPDSYETLPSGPSYDWDCDLTGAQVITDYDMPDALTLDLQEILCNDWSPDDLDFTPPPLILYADDGESIRLAWRWDAVECAYVQCRRADPGSGYPDPPPPEGMTGGEGYIPPKVIAPPECVLDNAVEITDIDQISYYNALAKLNDNYCSTPEEREPLPESGEWVIRTSNITASKLLYQTEDCYCFRVCNCTELNPDDNEVTMSDIWNTWFGYVCPQSENEAGEPVPETLSRDDLFEFDGTVIRGKASIQTKRVDTSTFELVPADQKYDMVSHLVSPAYYEDFKFSAIINCNSLEEDMFRWQEDQNTGDLYKYGLTFPGGGISIFSDLLPVEAPHIETFSQMIQLGLDYQNTTEAKDNWGRAQQGYLNMFHRAEDGTPLSGGGGPVAEVGPDPDGVRRWRDDDQAYDDGRYVKVYMCRNGDKVTLWVSDFGTKDEIESLELTTRTFKDMGSSLFHTSIRGPVRLSLSVTSKMETAFRNVHVQSDLDNATTEPLEHNVIPNLYDTVNEQGWYWHSASCAWVKYDESYVEEEPFDLNPLVLFDGNGDPDRGWMWNTLNCQYEECSIDGRVGGYVPPVTTGDTGDTGGTGGTSGTGGTGGFDTTSDPQFGFNCTIYDAYVITSEAEVDWFSEQGANSSACTFNAIRGLEGYDVKKLADGRYYVTTTDVYTVKGIIQSMVTVCNLPSCKDPVVEACDDSLSIYNTEGVYNTWPIMILNSRWSYRDPVTDEVLDEIPAMLFQPGSYEHSQMLTFDADNNCIRFNSNYLHPKYDELYRTAWFDGRRGAEPLAETDRWQGWEYEDWLACQNDQYLLAPPEVFGDQAYYYSENYIGFKLSAEFTNNTRLDATAYHKVINSSVYGPDTEFALNYSDQILPLYQQTCGLGTATPYEESPFINSSEFSMYNMDRLPRVTWNSSLERLLKWSMQRNWWTGSALLYWDVFLDYPDLDFPDYNDPFLRKANEPIDGGLWWKTSVCFGKLRKYVKYMNSEYYRKGAHINFPSQLEDEWNPWYHSFQTPNFFWRSRQDWVIKNICYQDHLFNSEEQVYFYHHPEEQNIPLVFDPSKDIWWEYSYETCVWSSFSEPPAEDADQPAQVFFEAKPLIIFNADGTEVERAWSWNSFNCRYEECDYVEL